MYSAEYRIYMLYQLESVLNGSYIDKTFIVHLEDEDKIRLIKVPYPYFRKPNLLALDPFEEEE
jgi:N6-adenosine-specific RNA methylase IME4